MLINDSFEATDNSVYCRSFLNLVYKISYGHRLKSHTPDRFVHCIKQICVL